MLVLIAVISAFSVPAIRAFSVSGDSLDGASRLVQLLLHAQGQAIRRSRAVSIQLQDFSPGGPGGLVVVFEGSRSSCVGLIEAPGERLLSTSLRFGAGEDLAGRQGNYQRLSLSGWRLPGRRVSHELLSLCLSPRGVALVEDAGAFRPFEGELEILLQHHEEGGAALPPRRVLLPFAGGPRLALN